MHGPGEIQHQDPAIFVKQLRLLLHCMICTRSKRTSPHALISAANQWNIKFAYEQSSLAELERAVAETVQAFRRLPSASVGDFQTSRERITPLSEFDGGAVAFMATETETSMKQLGLAQTKLGAPSKFKIRERLKPACRNHCRSSSQKASGCSLNRVQNGSVGGRSRTT